MTKLRARMEEIGEHLRQFAAEEAILTAAGLGDWDRVFALLDEMKRPIDQGAAGQCLEWALHHAPWQTFDRLLDRLPGGEHAGKIVIRDFSTNGGDNDALEASGTLVLLAAACGKTEQLRCLLDHGWDVNSASPDAARSLRARISGIYASQKVFAPPAEPYSARRESTLCFLSEDEDEHKPWRYARGVLPGATPLAAAVICGRTDCARLLMDYGAWREEAHSVARVLMMRLREDDAQYQACREAVLSYGETPHPMELWSVIHICTPEQLQAELHRCRYSDEAIAEAVMELTGENWRNPFWRYGQEVSMYDGERLRILEQYAPQVFRQENIVGRLLYWGLMQGDEEDMQEFLPRLCPERVDLSMLRGALMYPGARRVSRFLRCLAQGRTCVMDRDSVPWHTSPLVLQTLFKCVTFLPPTVHEGVSGLSYAILRTNNLKLIRSALETGLIPPEESARDLLACHAESESGSAAVRAAILSTPRPEVTENQAVQDQTPAGPYRWGVEREWERAAQSHPPMGGLLPPGHPGNREDVTLESEDGVWHLDSEFAVMCVTGRSGDADHWVRDKADNALRQVFSLRPEEQDYELMGTALCLAAFAGQRETVETLLSLGAEAEEQHMGMPGILRLDNGARELPVTALEAALVQGHWEIARLLLRHGAVCDLGQQAVQAVWQAFRQDDMEETLRRHLEGYVSGVGGKAFLTKQ